MRDLAFVGFLVALLALGLRRPFVLVLGYVYIDIVSPQRLSYYLLNSIPISLIFFAAAVIGWAVADGKDGVRPSGRQFLIVLLLAWAAWTTAHADFPIEAMQKWAWVWKSLVFAIFLPLTLRTRLRMEALLAFMILSASSIIIIGGIKTLASGGGYGTLNLGVSNNTGLYEGSIISTVAIAIIPLILFLARHQTLFPERRLAWLFACALIFACLLIPIGTEARTGLICIGVLAILMLRDVKRRLLYVGVLCCAVAAARPLLPASYTERMHTIGDHKADESASTRLAVWAWTWDYVQKHPAGGGFAAYLQNRLRYQTVAVRKAGETASITTEAQTDAGRAYHSSYFEMLGEQGFPGLALWLLLMLSGLMGMEVLRRRFRGGRGGGGTEWIAPLATALQAAHIIYMVGSLFVGIAFEPFVYMLIGLQIGLAGYGARVRAGMLRGRAMIGAPRPLPARAIA